MAIVGAALVAFTVNGAEMRWLGVGGNMAFLAALLILGLRALRGS